MKLNLSKEDLDAIDMAFHCAQGESYLSKDHLPVWNKIRAALGKPLMVHDPIWGILPSTSKQIGKPRPEPTNPMFRSQDVRSFDPSVWTTTAAQINSKVGLGPDPISPTQIGGPLSGEPK